jgi:hypothetical protein
MLGQGPSGRDGMLEKPRFIQGIFNFEGRGLERPSKLTPEVEYTVPRDKRAQLVYLRAGNSTDEMVYLVLSQNERPVRYFPIGAKGAVHVALAIVEDVPPETRIGLSLGAPEGARGTLLVDLGLVEI